jgi:hypothetical protein
MECCRCEIEIHSSADHSYVYDDMGNIWCNSCMEDEEKK